MYGIGVEFDFKTGTIRNWYQGADGVRRWLGTSEPCESNLDTSVERVEKTEKIEHE